MDGDLGDKFHQISPSVIDERLYALSTEGNVLALDKNSGQTIWSVDLNLELLAGVGVGAGKVVVASESGEVISLDAENGSELWRKQMVSEVVSEPQLNQDLVVVQMINGNIAALESDTGSIRWLHDSAGPRLTLRGTSSPLVALDVTLAGLDNGKFVALDNQTGAVLWEQRVSLPEGRSELERMTDVDGRPLLFENVIYIPGFQGQLVALNPFNAQTLWKKKVSSYRSLAAGFGNVYVTEANDHVQAFDAQNAASVWKQVDLENRQLTSPAVLGNHVAVGDNEGYIHFMSQIDGRFIARFGAGSSLTGDLIVKDDVLYAQTDSGRIFALTLK